MMNGIHLIHERGYAHRDLKPENIMLASDFALKINDLGFTCDLKGEGFGVLTDRLGSPGYMAP